MDNEALGSWIVYSMITAALGVVVGGIAYEVGYVRGGAETARVLTRPEVESQCLCGDSQTCAFGIGIVGKQTCTTNSFMRNIWSRCEPAEVKP